MLADVVRDLRGIAATRSRHVVRTVGDLTVKVFCSCPRDEARREWTALTTLWRVGHRQAPKPVWSALDDPHPAIAMSRVPGTPLREAVLSEVQLEALARVLSDAYRRMPAEGPPANGAAGVLCMRLRDALPVRADAAWPDVARDAHGAVKRWLEGGEVRTLSRTAPLVWGRGDPNLANFLWDGERLFHVDFEDSGLHDVATELADLVEHLGARATPNATWHSFVARFELDEAQRRRHLTARRALACWWFADLLPGGPAHPRNPAGTLERQAERVLGLLS